MKKLPLISIFLLSIFIPLRGLGQWTLQNVNTVNNIYCVDYFSLSEIWMGATDGLIKSTDGGNTWNTYPLTDNLGNSILGGYLLDIHVFSSSIAVATGFLYLGNNECILRTTNGGLNWTIVSNYNGGPLPRNLNDIYFPTASIGFAVGSNGRILKSTNGGSTWSALTSGTTVEMKSVFFTSATTGFAVGDDRILKTTNGGTSWSQTSYSGSSFNSVVFADALNGYAADGNLIRKTINGGNSWQISDPHINNGLTSIYADTSGIVYACGAGIILKSSNAGTYWETQSPSGYVLYLNLIEKEENALQISRCCLFQTY